MEDSVESNATQASAASLLEMPSEIREAITSLLALPDLVNLRRVHTFFHNGIDWLRLIKYKIDPQFSQEDLDFCKNGLIANDSRIFAIFSKLNNLNYHAHYDSGSMDLETLVLNLEKDSELQKIVYRLILSSNQLYAKFTKPFIKPTELIRRLGITHGLCVGPVDFSDKVIIDTLFNNDKCFNRLKPENWVDLCKSSVTIFKRLLVEKPEMAKQVLASFPPYEITEILTPECRSVFSLTDVQTINSLGYRSHQRYGFNLDFSMNRMGFLNSAPISSASESQVPPLNFHKPF